MYAFELNWPSAHTRTHSHAVGSNRDNEFRDYFYYILNYEIAADNSTCTISIYDFAMQLFIVLSAAVDI